jgi:hypothetical protein
MQSDITKEPNKFFKYVPTVDTNSSTINSQSDLIATNTLKGSSSPNFLKSDQSFHKPPRKSKSESRRHSKNLSKEHNVQEDGSQLVQKLSELIFSSKENSTEKLFEKEKIPRRLSSKRASKKRPTKISSINSGEESLHHRSASVGAPKEIFISSAIEPLQYCSSNKDVSKRLSGTFPINSGEKSLQHRSPSASASKEILTRSANEPLQGYLFKNCVPEKPSGVLINSGEELLRHRSPSIGASKEIFISSANEPLQCCSSNKNVSNKDCVPERPIGVSFMSSGEESLQQRSQNIRASKDYASKRLSHGPLLEKTKPIQSEDDVDIDLYNITYDRGDANTYSSFYIVYNNHLDNKINIFCEGIFRKIDSFDLVSGKYIGKHVFYDIRKHICVERRLSEPDDSLRVYILYSKEWNKSTNYPIYVTCHMFEITTSTFVKIYPQLISYTQSKISDLSSK